jgi:DeoR/GlpR family transcriptional regulator of sugar metabolism
MNSHAPPTLSPDTRRLQITEVLDHQGECSIGDLAQRFGVSGMTIRRDLQELADAGQAVRTRGGAAPAARVSFEFRFLERTNEKADEKQEIAAVACSLVRPGDAVLLDSSTTTLAIAHRLKAISDLTVITTSLPIASELFSSESTEVILLGGTLRKDSPDLIGAITDSSLDMLRADVAFIGADAVDRRGNIYNASADLGRMLGRMANAASRVYAVADHSKIGRHELLRFANIADWYGLVTDSKLDRSLCRDLRRAGVSLHQPDKRKGTRGRRAQPSTPKKTLH